MITYLHIKMVILTLLELILMSLWSQHQLKICWMPRFNSFKCKYWANNLLTKLIFLRKYNCQIKLRIQSLITWTPSKLFNKTTPKSPMNPLDLVMNTLNRSSNYLNLTRMGLSQLNSIFLITIMTILPGKIY